MALFMKQDFTPPVLSRKWIAIKLRPNVLIHSVEHIVCILESGLLFREDSAVVEQGAPSHHEAWVAAGGASGGWFTRGEQVASLAAVVACAAVHPPRGLHRSTLCHVTALSLVPLIVRACHRRWGRGGAALARLLSRARDYLALARRAAACLREYKALHKDLQCVTSCVQSAHALLCRQQTELAVLCARASSALLGNAPWLRDDVCWDQVDQPDQDLLKIHHAFLVMQSTLLRHIAQAHFVPPRHMETLYRNRNERIHWIHTDLIPHIAEQFKHNYEALERMYRLLKNYGNLDANVVKKPGFAINDSWLYSEVHNGVARSSLELKVVLNKCVNLDVFLDSCALNRQEIDLDVLGRDLEDLVDGIGRCLSTVQSSQLRLKKMQYKIGAKSDRKVENNNDCVAVQDNEVRLLRIEDKDPETKDEVFYFVKTEDDSPRTPPAEDVTTAPGVKEKEATRVVLNELKRKLVRREDLMRERERQALAHTMPELQHDLPEFPRQMPTDLCEKKGFITKLHTLRRQRRLKSKPTFKKNRHGWQFANTKRTYVLSPKPEVLDDETDNFEAKLSLKHKLKTLLTVQPISKTKLQITKWFRHEKEHTPTEKFNYKEHSPTENFNYKEHTPAEKFNYKEHTPTENFNYKSKSNSSLSDGLLEFDGEKMINQAINRATNQATNAAAHEAKNLSFTKKDLELSLSSSDSEEQHRQQVQLLKDVRRHRVTRKKNFPSKRGSLTLEDEGLRPVEYSFGTGMAIASVLRIGTGNRPSFSREDVFIGDGEVSEDSGNDDEA